MQWRAYPDDSNMEEIKRMVEKYFTVYESRQEENVFVFFIELPLQEEILQQNFDLLLEDLKKKNLIPFLRERNGEYVIFITYKPRVKGKPEWINVALFIATVITTMFMGTFLYLQYLQENVTIESILMTKNLVNGIIFFSLPLLAILGVHEFGHYILSKKHGVAASLPYFIPIPIPPIGTMGAVISMREPIPDRKALLDIGIAGPIAGFLVTIPVFIMGLYFMQENPVIVGKEGGISIGFPLLGIALSHFFQIPDDALMHPTAFAGWVGLLVTAINLLPAGQLDGGHIARAVLKEKHKYVSFATVILLASLSFFGMGNWLFFLLLLVFLIGTEHPPPLNEFVSLDGKRKFLAFIAVLIFVLSFTPMPMSISQ